MWVQSQGLEHPLEKEMATHSSILVWEIPWTVEPGRLQSMGLQRGRYDLATKQEEGDSLKRKTEKAAAVTVQPQVAQKGDVIVFV